MNLVYAAIFHQEESSYWVEFPDLEGCNSYGDDLVDTMLNTKFKHLQLCRCFYYT